MRADLGRTEWTYNNEGGNELAELLDGNLGGALNRSEDDLRGLANESLERGDGAGEDVLDLTDGAADGLNSGVLGGDELWKYREHKVNANARGVRTEDVSDGPELGGHISEDDSDALRGITGVNAADSGELGRDAGDSRDVRDRADRVRQREGGGEGAESERGEHGERAEGEHFVEEGVCGVKTVRECLVVLWGWEGEKDDWVSMLNLVET